MRLGRDAILGVRPSVKSRKVCQMNISSLNKVSAWVIVLIVPVLLVLGSIRLLLTDTYLQIEYGKPDFPADYYGFTREDRLAYAPIAIDYLLNGAPISYLSDRTFPDGSPLFTESENGHMRDVKNVIQGAFTVGLLSLILFVITSSILLRERDGRRLYRSGLRGGAILLLGILGLLVVYIVLDWQNFFDRFHNLFFADGTWTFDYSTTLIRLFPIRFWQDAALTVGGLAALGSAAIIGVTLWLDRRSDRHATSTTDGARSTLAARSDYAR